MVKKIITAKHRGFCAGVVLAIDLVEIALEKYGPPVYVKHQIVHNPVVVSEVEFQWRRSFKTKPPLLEKKDQQVLASSIRILSTSSTIAKSRSRCTFSLDS